MTWKDWGVPSIISAVVGVVAVGISYAAFQRNTENDATLIGERIRGNEVRLEKLAPLESRVNQLLEMRSDLRVLEGRLEQSATDTDFREIEGLIRAFEDRLEALEQRPAGTGAVAPEQIAAILAQNYAEQLRGPKGDTGAQGPAGPAGPAGEGKGPVFASSEEVRELMQFTSDFPVRRVGDFEVQLVACRDNGGVIQCQFKIVLDASQRQDLVVNADDGSDIALENGQWLRADRGVIRGVSGTGYDDVRTTAIPGVPYLVELDFEGASIKSAGLQVVKLSVHRPRGIAEWQHVALSD